MFSKRKVSWRSQFRACSAVAQDESLTGYSNVTYFHSKRPAVGSVPDPTQREMLHHRSKQDRHAPILLRGTFECPGCRAGEAVHFVRTGGDNRPYRWRVGAPSYPNLSSINNPDHHPVTNMLCRCWTLLEVQEVQAALWRRQTGQDQWS